MSKKTFPGNWDVIQMMLLLGIRIRKLLARFGYQNDSNN